jgi:hypothetical protein
VGLNTTNFGYALKNLWPQSRMAEMTFKDNPLLAMLPKKEDAGGDVINVAVRYGDPQGRSAAFATAQANKGNQSGVKFALTRVSDYSLASIGNEVVEASKSNEQALLKAMDSEISGAYNSLVRSAAVKAYGSGSGKIGQIASSGGISGATITLATAVTGEVSSDITNFEKGMVIVLSSTDGGGSLRNSGATLTISGVDRETGIITCSANITTGIAAAANGDYIFVQGDYDAALKGLQAWLPSSVTATTFFGIDRTVDATRLGGIRYSGTTTIKDALTKASMRAGREGANLDYYFMSYDDWGNLELELGSQVQYVDVESEAGFGFRGIKVNGPKRPITVLPDMNCPRALAFGLQMNTWKLYSVGKVPHIIDLDGNKFLREASADAYEVRIAYYAQLGCESPGYNVRVALPT